MIGRCRRDRIRIGLNLDSIRIQSNPDSIRIEVLVWTHLKAHTIEALHLSRYIHSTSNKIHTVRARVTARAKTGGHKGIRGKRRIPTRDKLLLYTPEY